MKKLIDLVFPAKQIKYTCSCCGYKTLPSNSMGELCPICFWEEGYDDSDALFGVSDTNHMTLYQGQENYKKFDCCSQDFISRCRKPNNNETKDFNWLSIQEKIEKDTDLSSSLKKLEDLGEQLKQVNVDVVFTNFKSLPEIEITKNYEDMELDYYESGEDIPNISNQLFLKSLLINVSKKDLNLMTELFSKYYKKGIEYYISWSIICFVLTELNEFKLNVTLTDLFLDIENNNYYELDSLEKVLKEFWHKQKNH